MNESVIFVCRSLSESDEADEDVTLTEHGKFLNRHLILKMIRLLNF